jgi:hypothetical protein
VNVKKYANFRHSALLKPPFYRSEPIRKVNLVKFANHFG